MIDLFAEGLKVCTLSEPYESFKDYYVREYHLQFTQVQVKADDG